MQRFLIVATINSDIIRSNKAIWQTIANIKMGEIDIARIQKTHNKRTDSINISGYDIFFG